MRAFEFLTESRPRTLYHGTLKSNLPSIMQNGLEPRIGAFTSHFYDPNEDDLQELVFASSRRDIQKGINAIIHLLKDEGIPSTPENVIKYGVMLVIKDEYNEFEHRASDDANYWGEYPSQVEPGDFFAREPVNITHVLQNKKLKDLLRREGFDAWMGTKHPKLMQAAEIFTETLRQSYDYIVSQDSKEDYTASFMADNAIKYTVKIREIDYNEVEIEFSAYGHLTPNDDVDLSSGITNTGKAFPVFATVIAIIKDYVRKYDPKVIEFTAKEPSRVKLYRALVQKITAQFGSHYNSGEENAGSFVYFTIRKIK